MNKDEEKEIEKYLENKIDIAKQLQSDSFTYGYAIYRKDENGKQIRVKPLTKEWWDALDKLKTTNHE